MDNKNLSKLTDSNKNNSLKELFPHLYNGPKDVFFNKLIRKYIIYLFQKIYQNLHLIMIIFNFMIIMYF